MSNPEANPERIILRDTVFVRLTTVARCYQVEVAWIEEVYQLGLLGRGEDVDGAIAIEAVQLDRVARIVQLHFHHGVNLAGVSLLLGPLER